MTEKKTIGSFIAVLRKANGMTQRELAEMLNVSDKAVSRWEREECAPDLSLIPVIAEIFHITTDELLRGERNAPTGETGGSTVESSLYIREKSIRQFQNLLRTQLMRLKERSMIAIGIMLAGFITALICNFVFTKAVLGFFLSLVFYAGALIAEICFLRRARVDEDDTYDYGKWLTYQNNVTALGVKTFFALWMLLGVTLPLLFVIEISGVNAGLKFDAYLLSALIFGLAFLLIAHIADLFFIKTKLSQKGLFFMTDADKKNLKLKQKLFAKVSLISASTAVVLLAAAIFFMESVTLFVKKLEFTDYDSFKEYMEYTPELNASWSSGYSPYDTTDESDYIIICPSEEDYVMHTVEDREGNILCEYTAKRKDVLWLEHSFDKSPDGLPIYVITESNYDMASGICKLIAVLLCVLAAANILIAAVIYVKKSKKYA